MKNLPFINSQTKVTAIISYLNGSFNIQCSDGDHKTGFLNVQEAVDYLRKYGFEPLNTKGDK